MSTYTPYDYKSVTQLNSTTATSSDLFLVSQLSGTEYISRKLPYSELCSLLLKDMDELIESGIYEYISELSSQVYTNVDNISALSIDTKYLVSAVIKMANCIQTNKTNISILTTLIENATCENGLSIKQNPLENGIVIGHTNIIEQSDEEAIYKMRYDENGHIVEASKVDMSDFQDLGIFLTETSDGLEIADNGARMNLLPATEDTIGGVIIGDNLTVDENGKINAVNTQYFFSDGLSSYENDNNVYGVALLEAGRDTIGGIKLGDDFHLDENGCLKTDITTPIADTDTLGSIKANCVFAEETRIPLQVDSNGNSYVEIDMPNNDVDLSEIESLLRTLSADVYDDYSYFDYDDETKKLDLKVGPYYASTYLDFNQNTWDIDEITEALSDTFYSKDDIDSSITTGMLFATAIIADDLSVKSLNIDSATVEIDTATIDDVTFKSASSVTLEDKGQTLKDYVESTDGNPVGTIILMAGNIPPPKYLKCDGVPYARSLYPQLFNLLSETLNTINGVEYFTVPDITSDVQHTNYYIKCEK